MTTAAFDVQPASEALTRLGQSIVDDEAFRTGDWDALTVVGELAGGKSMFGYIYRADGSWTARTPKDFGVLRKMGDLRKAMSRPDAADWNYCLIQVKRAGMKMHAEFDYGDGDKWKVTPDNLKTRVEELKPR